MTDVSREDKNMRFPPGVLGPTDRLLMESLRDLVEREVLPVRRDLDAEARRGEDGIFAGLNRKIRALGMPGALLPEEYGGEGLTSCLSWCLATEELGRGDGSLCAVLSASLLALRPAVVAGNGEVLRRFAPQFLDEKEHFYGCFAVHEGVATGDALNPDLVGRGLSFRVEEKDGYLSLSGSKAWCVNAPWAGMLCVAGTTEPGQDEEGIALVYGEIPAKGLHVLGSRGKTGLLSAPVGDLRLEGVRVPDGWRAAGPGEDSRLLWENVAFGRLLAAAAAVGMAQGAFEEVLAFTSDRLAAGKPIRQHTVCAAILADVATGIQAGRDAYLNAALVFDSFAGADDGATITLLSRASLVRSLCFRESVGGINRAMELTGSYGYVTDYHLEKYWRDVKMMQLLDVVYEQLKMDIARGYFRFQTLHPNPLYELMQARRTSV